MGKRTAGLAASLILLLALYLLTWPVPIDPAAWQPPDAPSQEAGPHASNEALAGVERLAEGFADGPEAIAIDHEGRLVTGYADGRIVRMLPDGEDIEVLADTRGRPLGLHVLADDSILIADAREGLLRLADGYVHTLSLSADGVPYRLTDDVVVSSDGRYAYFTDASHRFGIDEYMLDALEHRPNGRLLVYDLEEGGVRLLADGLYFANGVALGPDERYLLVNETTRYRILRYWLTGEREGEIEVFADNLPGFPDNITFNGEDRYWVALASSRDPMLDRMLPYPFLRRMAARLPDALRPGLAHHAWVLAFDTDGTLVADLQHRARDAYAPVTSAIEHDGYLYLGSLTAPAVARIAIDEAIQAAEATRVGRDSGGADSGG